MTTLSWISRGGPPAALLAAVMAVAPASAARTPPHRYSVSGSLTPVAAGTANGGAVQLKSSLTAPAPSSNVQSGGNFVVMAKIVASPLGCASDTIFVDGFDGP